MKHKKQKSNVRHKILIAIKKTKLAKTFYNTYLGGVISASSQTNVRFSSLTSLLAASAQPLRKLQYNFKKIHSQIWLNTAVPITSLVSNVKCFASCAVQRGNHSNTDFGKKMIEYLDFSVIISICFQNSFFPMPHYWSNKNISSIPPNQNGSLRWRTKSFANIFIQCCLQLDYNCWSYMYIYDLDKTACHLMLKQQFWNAMLNR